MISVVYSMFRIAKSKIKHSISNKDANYIINETIEKECLIEETYGYVINWGVQSEWV